MNWIKQTYELDGQTIMPVADAEKEVDQLEGIIEILWKHIKKFTEKENCDHLLEISCFSTPVREVVDFSECIICPKCGRDLRQE